MGRKNYDSFTETQQKVVDNIYNVINKYCKEEGIKIAYDDRAEKFVEAIATYLVESREN